MLTHHHNTDGAAAQLGTVTVTRGGTMLKLIVLTLSDTHKALSGTKKYFNRASASGQNL
jgi:hypothetical protein